jgi:hypothetical protein
LVRWLVRWSVRRLQRSPGCARGIAGAGGMVGGAAPRRTFLVAKQFHERLVCHLNDARLRLKRRTDHCIACVMTGMQTIAASAKHTARARARPHSDGKRAAAGGSIPTQQHHITAHRETRIEPMTGLTALITATALFFSST